MNLLIFSRYLNTQASTRMRFNLFEPALLASGFQVSIFPIIAEFTIGGKVNSFLSALNLLKSRINSIINVQRKLANTPPDTLIHVHLEFFPWIPYWLEKLLLSLAEKKHFSVELDDAWFHRYDNHSLRIVRWVLGKKIDKVMRDATCVIAGNAYIANRARAAGAKCVEIVPTVVDTDKYKIAKPNFTEFQNEALNTLPVIGWIGSPSTTKFLLTIEQAIHTLNNKQIARFVAFGADANQLMGLPITVIPWNENAEISTLYGFDIGIMPLADSMFERGKCGYKLIQYMACGLPVVASPVGVNIELVHNNESGYLAKNADEWVHYLTLLCQDEVLRNKFGNIGLQHAIDNYSLKVTAPKVVAIFKSLACK